MKILKKHIFHLSVKLYTHVNIPEIQMVKIKQMKYCRFNLGCLGFIEDLSTPKSVGRGGSWAVLFQ